MKIAMRALLMIVIAAAGFAAGFPAGRSTGFSLGSEWALVQAELLAREEGIFLPVRFEDGQFRIILKQRRNMYRNASQLAARHENGIGQFAGYVLRSVSDVGAARKEAPGRPTRWTISPTFETYLSAERQERISDGVPACGESFPVLLAWQQGGFQPGVGRNAEPACEQEWLQLAYIKER